MKKTKKGKIEEAIKALTEVQRATSGDSYTSFRIGFAAGVLQSLLEDE